MESLTIQQAFLAMYLYLDAYYQRTGSDDIGALLGDLSLLADGSTADSAAMNDFLQAVNRAKAGQVSANLVLNVD